MEGDFNEKQMDDDPSKIAYSPSWKMDDDPSMIAYSPSRNLNYYASDGYPSSMPSSSQKWILSVGRDDRNANSSTLSPVCSPSRLPGWPCEKTFHPEREVEIQGGFNEMLRGGFMDYDISLMLDCPSPKALSPEASWSVDSLPSDRTFFEYPKTKRRYSLGVKFLFNNDLLGQRSRLLGPRFRLRSEGNIDNIKIEGFQGQRLNLSNGLLNGEEMLQQDSQCCKKHQLVGETHAMNHGGNVLVMCSDVSYPENKCTGKTRKRKLTVEDLQQFSGRRKDAAKSFEVSESTIKRCLRDHGIDDWRNRIVDKNNRSLFESKDIKSIQGEGVEMGNQMASGSRSCQRELNNEQIDFRPESKKGSDSSHIGIGLTEESSTQMETTPTGNMFASSGHEQCTEAGDYSELSVQPSELNLSVARLRRDTVNSTLPQITEGVLLIENSRSSRESSVHHISATEALNAKRVPNSSRTNLLCCGSPPKLATAIAAHVMPLVTETQDTRTVTLKATYREDMIKFQLSLTSGINELRKEVAKRLMLEVGTFSIKYLDNDNDWILITCDEDLKDCFNISMSLRRNVIKLLIHDVRPISGAPDKAMEN